MIKKNICTDCNNSFSHHVHSFYEPIDRLVKWHILYEYFFCSCLDSLWTVSLLRILVTLVTLLNGIITPRWISRLCLKSAKFAVNFISSWIPYLHAVTACVALDNTTALFLQLFHQLYVWKWKLNQGVNFCMEKGPFVS